MDDLFLIYDDFASACADIGRAVEFGQTAADPRLRVIIQNNMIVLLTSTIEETIRNLIGHYLEIIQANIPRYELLPRRLQSSNLEALSDSLRLAIKEGDNISARRFAGDLMKCIEGAPQYVLAIHILSQGNFKSEQLTKSCKRIGLDGVWRKICDDNSIEEFTGLTNVAARVGKIITGWNELFNERDAIVHRISQASGWGKNRILESIEFAKLLLRRVCDCLTDSLRQTLATAAQQASPRVR